MKTINAFLIVNDFSERMAAINTTLRTSSYLEQIKSVKDFIVSVRTSKISIAVETIAKRFEQDSKKEKESGTSEMLRTWSGVMYQRVTAFKELSQMLDGIEEATEMAIRYYQGSIKILDATEVNTLKKSTDLFLKGTKHYTEDLNCLKIALEVFNIFVRPKMTQDELKPQAEDIFLN